MNFVTYFRMMFVIAAIVLVLVCAINYVINPIGIYGSPVIKGFNEVHPTASLYARIRRSEDIKRIRPEVLIVGTSCAMIGLDPQPEMFGGAKVYNAGLSASSVAEHRRVLEFAQAVQPLKKAVITMDFFSYNAQLIDRGAETAQRFNPKSLTPLRAAWNRYNTLPTLDTLIASQKHIRYTKRPNSRSIYMPNGRLHQYDFLLRVQQGGSAQFFEMDLKMRGDGDDPTGTKLEFTTQYKGKNAGETYQHLEAMLTLARQNNIELILVFAPIHETYMRRFEREGEWTQVLEWKQRIRNLVMADGVRHGAEPYPLWDFQYRNSITTEELPPLGDTTRFMKWFHDDNHYSPAAGDIVLKKILGLYEEGKDPYPDFGKKLL